MKRYSVASYADRQLVLRLLLDGLLEKDEIRDVVASLSDLADRSDEKAATKGRH